MATIDFENGTIGSGWTFNPTGASVVNDTDTGGGTTKALRLPDIGDNESATAEIDLDTGDGDVVIRFRVSSEGGFDEVFITLDGNDVGQGAWSGDPGYLEISKTVTTGIHTLLFNYVKDSSASANQDTVFISSITFPPGAVAQTLTATLLDRDGNPNSNLSGLKYRWYDESPVSAWGVIQTEGINGTTDSNGNLSLSIMSGLSAGESGTLILETSSGADKGIYSVPFTAGDLVLDDPKTTAGEVFLTDGKPPAFVNVTAGLGSTSGDRLSVSVTAGTEISVTKIVGLGLTSGDRLSTVLRVGRVQEANLGSTSGDRLPVNVTVGTQDSVIKTAGLGATSGDRLPVSIIATVRRSSPVLVIVQ